MDALEAATPYDACHSELMTHGSTGGGSTAGTLRIQPRSTYERNVMSTMQIDRTTTSLLQEGGCWRLDLTRSRAEFRVKHLWGLATVTGHFEDFDGALTVGPDGELEIELDIDAESVATRNLQRDTHLRSADFFDVANHPLVHFSSKRIVAEESGRRLHVVGELEAAGRRVPIELGAELQVRGDELEIRATTKVDQRRLGMAWSRLGVRSPAVLDVSALLVRQ
jgi:polyisoprenoid-binding protein YceI